MRIVQNTNKSLAQVARDLGINAGTLGNWVARDRANAAADAFFSTLENEVLSHFTTRAEARAIVVAWCLDFYNTRRRHSSAGLQSPDQYEKTTAEQQAAA